MKSQIIELSHLAILITIGTFLTLFVLALRGTFDIWGKRYIKPRKGGRFLPTKFTRIEPIAGKV